MQLGLFGKNKFTYFKAMVIVFNRAKWKNKIFQMSSLRKKIYEYKNSEGHVSENG